MTSDPSYPRMHQFDLRTFWSTKAGKEGINERKLILNISNHTSAAEGKPQYAQAQDKKSHSC